MRMAPPRQVFARLMLIAWHSPSGWWARHARDPAYRWMGLTLGRGWLAQVAVGVPYGRAARGAGGTSSG